MLTVRLYHIGWNIGCIREKIHGDIFSLMEIQGLLFNSWLGS